MVLYLYMFFNLCVPDLKFDHTVFSRIIVIVILMLQVSFRYIDQLQWLHLKKSAIRLQQYYPVTWLSGLRKCALISGHGTRAGSSPVGKKFSHGFPGTGAHSESRGKWEATIDIFLRLNDRLPPCPRIV